MDEIVKMEHVYQYNEMMGQETLHPLVSVIDFSKCPKARHARRMYGFYCVFLKDVKCGDMRYGRHYYDYQEGTLVFIAPGQVVGIEVKLAAAITDADVRHLLWLRDQRPDEVVDLVMVTTGRHAYRRPDGVAVVPLALLGA